MSSPANETPEACGFCKGSGLLFDGELNDHIECGYCAPVQPPAPDPDEMQRDASLDALVSRTENPTPACLDCEVGGHRDLTRRLGFGDNITEPMADNDTIVAWFQERGREADEWRESQRWRDDCALAGHDPLNDCPSCDPMLRLTAERDAAREMVVRVIAAAQQIDKVRELHQPFVNDYDGHLPADEYESCKHCIGISGHRRWPCPTIALLDAGRSDEACGDDVPDQITRRLHDAWNQGYQARDGQKPYTSNPWRV